MKDVLDVASFEICRLKTNLSMLPLEGAGLTSVKMRLIVDSWTFNLKTKS